MAYNNGREDRKWRIWKEAEEKVLYSSVVKSCASSLSLKSEKGTSRAARFARVRRWLFASPTKVFFANASY